VGEKMTSRSMTADAAKKSTERLFLDALLRHLRWTDVRVEDGAEPPDFFVHRGELRIAIEITRVYRLEQRKGSLDAQWERDLIRFVRDLHTAYDGGTAAQLMDVTVVFPSPIRSSAVRQLTPQEHKADRADVMRRALARLTHLPGLAPMARHKFAVRQRDGRPVTFHLVRLPTGAEHLKRWKPNITLGWVATLRSDALQAKVDAKSRDLPKYRAGVDAVFLLVVADSRRASGYVQLAQQTVIEPRGFDAVYFQRYDEYTRRVARSIRRRRIG
jgi:hypothetical protein